MTNLKATTPSPTRAARSLKTPLTIETCRARINHTHAAVDQAALHGRYDETFGSRTVQAFIELHQSARARGHYTRARRHRPELASIHAYAQSVHWAGPAKTDEEIAAERREAEERYDRDELTAAEASGLTIQQLRLAHWSQGRDPRFVHRRRQDLVWLRAGVESPAHRRELKTFFPNVPEDLSTFRFEWNEPQTCAGRDSRVPEAPAVQARLEGRPSRYKTRYQPDLTAQTPRTAGPQPLA